MFEWAWRRASKRSGGGDGVRRTKLREVLNRERWTARSPLAADVPLTLHWLPKPDGESGSGLLLGPPLRAEAYDASNLEIQLADQERRVLLAGDERFIQTDGDSVAAVTKLFEWYGGDFGADWKPYVARRVQKTVASPGFIDYRWELNTQ